MLILKTTFLSLVLLFIFTGSNQAQKTEAVIVEGKVVNEATGKPVMNAHVYILDGEEEALTNPNGEFSIRSWQKAPFKLTVEKPDGYEKTMTIINNPSARQMIRLKVKTK